MKTGKLIVFEGIDGSGKTTQLTLLKHYLDSRDIPNEVIDFPRSKYQGRTLITKSPLKSGDFVYTKFPRGTLGNDYLFKQNGEGVVRSEREKHEGGGMIYHTPPHPKNRSTKRSARIGV